MHYLRKLHLFDDLLFVLLQEAPVQLRRTGALTASTKQATQRRVKQILTNTSGVLFKCMERMYTSSVFFWGGMYILGS